jgi:CheY-like chemotaxis protein
METDEFMETENSLINVGQLAEAVRQHILQKYDPASPRMEIVFGRQCPALFESDRHKLYQTLIILAEQAAEYAVEGTFSIHIDSADSGDNRNTVEFRIEHPGVLALGDELEKIIDPDVSLLEWYPACVLRDQAVNLRVAARLLAKIGGRLRIDSHSGQTRYCAELPVCAVAGASEILTQKTEIKKESTLMQDQNKPIESPTERRTARILVVDDVEENRALLEVILCKLGYAPVQCSGGKQAVLLCRQEKYDIILMDIQMPEVDGFEAVKQIRADSLNAASPIIAMTASNQKDDELAALDCGCDDYLIKPINRKLLEQKIWRNLAKMRQIYEAEQGREITSFLEGDPDYHKTIETFVGNLPSRIDDIRQAFEKHDFKDLAFKVHALKGLGGFAGFAIYTDKAAKIEESLREKDVDKIQFQIDEMVQLCMRTKINSDVK